LRTATSSGHSDERQDRQSEPGSGEHLAHCFISLMRWASPHVGKADGIEDNLPERSIRKCIITFDDCQAKVR
jgi:hypothetical protein